MAHTNSSSNCTNPCTSCGYCTCSCATTSYETTGCLSTESTDCTYWRDIDVPQMGVKRGDTLTKVIKNIISYITNAFTKITSTSLAVTQVGSSNDNIGIELIPSTVQGNILNIAADGRPYVPKTDINLISGSCFSWQKTQNGQVITFVPIVDWNCVSQQVCGLCDNPVPCEAPTGVVVTGTSQTGAQLNWNSVSGVSYDALVNNVVQTSNVNSPYTFTSLSADTTYSLTIRAKCGSGLTADTAISVTTLPVTSCNTPSGLAVTITGGTAAITWTPGGGGGAQQVQYKLHSDASFTTYSTVSPSTNSESIPGLSQNLVYDFRVLNNCSGGVPSATSISKLEIGCVTALLTTADISITGQFATLGGSIDGYEVDLLDSTGTSILQSQTFTGPFSSTLSFTFSSLTASTSYNIRVKPSAGVTVRVNCALSPFTTTSTPACPPPTNLTLTLS